MIPITPLADCTMMMSVSVIARIEETPETVIVLDGGRRMVVVDVAQDLVRRIKRVHTNAIAAVASRAVETRDGDVLELPIARPAPPEADMEPALTVDISTPRQAASSESCPPISNVNLFHTGQIAFDRALAAIARHEWATSQCATDLDQGAERQLAIAHDTILDLRNLIDLEHSSDVAKSLANTLSYCISELANLDPKGGEGLPPKQSKDTLRSIKTTLTKLRKTWARIAAGTSWSTIVPALGPT